MSRGIKPTLIAVALSASAALGYVTYRVVFDRAPAEAHGGHEQAAELHRGADHDHAAEHQASALPDELPDFSMAGLDGTEVSIRSWPGQPLVINFWATWCAPCLREIPMLKAFQDEHPWLTVVGIAIDDMAKVQAFAEEMGFNYPILVGQTEGVNAAASFGVEFYALPFTIFTAADGQTLGVRTGELHAEHLDELVAVLEALRDGRTDIDGARARLTELL
ncbi:MAG: TlpA family protein disulfide reductase [Gammaproteobacteria bacterium]|nr:hypothetical protein [Gammaproteobacteria bacterium]